jgi:hypothetical protein
LKKHGLTNLSGEDLGSVGPVAMIQDLAMASALGITHVERNGHHYFKGLSMYSEAVQNDVLAAHQGTYHRRPDGLVALHIAGGQLDVRSVNRAPFGCGAMIDATQFEPLNAWIKRGGMGEL